MIESSTTKISKASTELANVTKIADTFPPDYVTKIKEISTETINVTEKISSNYHHNLNWEAINVLV